MLGTKCPSITSRWIQSAPAASTLRTSSPSLEKSDARIDGAMTRGRGANGWDMGASGYGASGYGMASRVTCAIVRGNAGGTNSCGRKNLPEAAAFAGGGGPAWLRKPNKIWVFRNGTALAEERSRV